MNPPFPNHSFTLAHTFRRAAGVSADVVQARCDGQQPEDQQYLTSPTHSGLGQLAMTPPFPNHSFTLAHTFRRAAGVSADVVQARCDGQQPEDEQYLTSPTHSGLGQLAMNPPISQSFLYTRPHIPASGGCVGGCGASQVRWPAARG